MTLQVFNPVDGPEIVTFDSNDKQIAEQLLADCVAEIKQFRSGALKMREAGEDSPQGADKETLERLQLQMYKLKVKDYKAGVAILNATPSQQKAVVLKAMASFVSDRYNDNVSDILGYELLKMLLRRKLVYDDTSIRQMLTCVQKDSIVCPSLPVLSILSNVKRNVEQTGLSKSIRNQLTKLLSTYKPDAYSADDRKIGLRIKEILDSEPKRSNAKQNRKPAQLPSPRVSTLTLAKPGPTQCWSSWEN